MTTPTVSPLAEGKTKIVRAGASPEEVQVEFKDSATAFNARKKADVPGKGALNAAISRMLFELLESHGIPTCYLRAGQQDNELIFRKLTMIPLEVVVRNHAYGSVVKRFNLEEGKPFERPLVEFFLKTADDPQVTDDMIAEMKLLPATTDLAEIKRRVLEVNELFVEFFSARGIRVGDFKAEFGVDAKGKLLLGDELSPDNFRLRDVQTGQVLDKDVFRLDLADLGDTYRQLLARLQSAPTISVPQTQKTYVAELFVTSRKGILNPESKAILSALHSLGFNEVESLHAGRTFRLTLQAARMIEAERRLRTMAETLLANPVIEDFHFTLGLA